MTQVPHLKSRFTNTFTTPCSHKMFNTTRRQQCLRKNSARICRHQLPQEIPQCPTFIVLLQLAGGSTSPTRKHIHDTFKTRTKSANQPLTEMTYSWFWAAKCKPNHLKLAPSISQTYRHYPSCSLCSGQFTSQACTFLLHHCTDGTVVAIFLCLLHTLPRLLSSAWYWQTNFLNCFMVKALATAICLPSPSDFKPFCSFPVRCIFTCFATNPSTSNLSTPPNLFSEVPHLSAFVSLEMPNSASSVP